MERYMIGELLGEGSFGNVFLAIKKSTKEKVRVFVESLARFSRFMRSIF